ncbi:hypothetical protein MMC31_006602 [Peltigera leucophlebia]|nr:hypothetical protein [Peltigera leucophlebia]
MYDESDPQKYDNPDSQKYDDPDPQRAPAEIHAKESTGDPTNRRSYEVRRSRLDGVPPASVTPTSGPVSVQPSDSVPPATVTLTGGPASVQSSKSPRSERDSRRSYEIRRSRPPKSPRRDPRAPVEILAKEIAGDPTKYDNPEPQKAPAAKEILAKEITGDLTQYDDPNRHGALAKAIVRDPTKERVPDRLSGTLHNSPSEYWSGYGAVPS